MEKNKELYALKQRFLDEWPIKRLQNLTLEEYTDTERKNSFCYWVEHVTRELGSVVGGSSYKFGIYKKGDDTLTKEVHYKKTDGAYAWFTKYGDTKEEAFNNIKKILINIAEFAIANVIESIDNIDLGPAYKWKIAFLYGDFNTINIFKIDALRYIFSNKKLSFTNKTPTSHFHKEILLQKESENEYFTYTHNLWEQYDTGLIDTKKEFATWLNNNIYDSYRNYLGNSINSIITKLEEINSFFDDIELYKVKEDQIQILIDTITFILSKNERIKNEDFVEYDLKNSNGIPKAILGKNGYCKFLKEKFNMKKNTLLEIKEDFIEYLKKTNYAVTTIGIYSDNLEKYLEYYFNKKNIDNLIQLNYKELSRISWKQYERQTHIQHKGKGHSNFTSFFENKIHLTTNSQIDNNLNQILYGPPGTGKTYKTKEEAVKIIDNKIYKDRKQLNSRYNELVEKGQIVFTSFHQSMSYEDFVEGIKPKTENGKVTYEVEDGLFKELALKAKGISGTKKNNESIGFSNVSYFKMSLGGKHRKDVHNWCIDSNHIALGWGGKNDFTDYLKLTNARDFKNQFKKEYPNLIEESSFYVQAMQTFQHSMKIGDVIIATLGNNIVDAIGVIEGEYTYFKDSPYPYHHIRKVKWLATSMYASPKLFIDKNISQQAIYEFNLDDVKIDVFKEQFVDSIDEQRIDKNYVLIIDEINRGNVSAIFGELITLIEDNKRFGNDEMLGLTLPYSNDIFTVPNNLYIIGTMNTADRSVEALDTALRRRFTFKEMMPKYNISELETSLNVDLVYILKIINQRIEILLDREHQIGHSYFLNINSEKELLNVFENKIIPLLQEYFYNDYDKIGLVLGKEFLLKEQNPTVYFADFDFDEKQELIQSIFSWAQLNEDNIIKKVQSIIPTNSRNW